MRSRLRSSAESSSSNLPKVRSAISTFGSFQLVASALPSRGRGRFATTLYDLRGWLAGRWPSDSADYHRYRSAYPGNTFAQGNLFGRASRSGYSRGCLGNLHPAWLVDTLRGSAGCCRRVVDRFDRYWRSVAVVPTSGSRRHAGNDWTWCVVDRCPAVRQKAYPKLKVIRISRPDPDES